VFVQVPPPLRPLNLELGAPAAVYSSATPNGDWARFPGPWGGQGEATVCGWMATALVIQGVFCWQWQWHAGSGLHCRWTWNFVIYTIRPFLFSFYYSIHPNYKFNFCSNRQLNRTILNIFYCSMLFFSFDLLCLVKDPYNFMPCLPSSLAKASHSPDYFLIICALIWSFYQLPQLSTSPWVAGG
jgi:hypothetical protein